MISGFDVIKCLRLIKIIWGYLHHWKIDWYCQSLNAWNTSHPDPITNSAEFSIVTLAQFQNHWQYSGYSLSSVAGSVISLAVLHQQIWSMPIFPISCHFPQFLGLLDFRILKCSWFLSTVSGSLFGASLHITGVYSLSCFP